MRIRRQALYPPEGLFQLVRSKVRQVLERGERIDYLALVPDGEPTLDIHLGEIISLFKSLGIPVAVISNASLITDGTVRAELSEADWVSLKVDAVSEEIWRKIDRPHRRLELSEILDGIMKFKEEFRGFLATETMMVAGMNDSDTAIRETAGFLTAVQPDTAYISIPTRPPADSAVRPAGAAELNSAYQIFSTGVKRVELLTGYEGNEFASTGNAREDILSITAVHPMRHDAVGDLLEKSDSGWYLIEEMIERGEILRSEFNGSVFFLRSFSGR
jgi:wyosine [tRNA(Phe)-imidazoG37] synthetase (radical SAM superfamily)